MSTAAAQARLAVDESTQVDSLTADGEYLYIAALHLTVCIYCTVIVVHEYKTKLTASEANVTAREEEQQELLQVLDQTKRICHARDLQISILESDGQEKSEY